MLEEHSFTLIQISPSPENPLRHVQILEPAVLTQLALTLQPPLFVEHSSLSMQTRPFPTYPTLHPQLNEPVMSVQAALMLQLCNWLLHSLTLVQLT